jgi:molecular chaperone DnaK
MKAEAEANAEADKKRMEEVEKINKADSLIFQTERQLKEYSDKIPADKKQAIEDALAELKRVYEAKEIANLEAAMDKLNTVFQAASQDMYNAAKLTLTIQNYNLNCFNFSSNTSTFSIVTCSMTTILYHEGW